MNATAALSRFTPAPRSSSPTADIAVANTSASPGWSRPSGTGRRRVRFIRLSGSRSITWLNADAPQATSAVPASIKTRRRAFGRVASSHEVPGERRGDDEEVEARLGQRDEVVRAGARLRQHDGACAGLHDRAPSGEAAETACRASRAGARSNSGLKVRSASTSDVPSTSAPFTTCAVFRNG